MADDDTLPSADELLGDTAEAAAPARPQLQVVSQFIRDMSFENPAAPDFRPPDGVNPDIRVEVNVNVAAKDENTHQVALDFKVQMLFEETPAFICELSYCGVFRLHNIPENDHRPVLLIEAPRQLFPFARRILADTTRDGGYPPLFLDPIDFLELYRRGQAAAADGAGGENAEDAASGENGVAEVEAAEDPKPKSKRKKKSGKSTD